MRNLESTKTALLSLLSEINDTPYTEDLALSRASTLRVNEPTIQTSEHYGKVPYGDHILEDDFEETPIEQILS